MRTALLLLAAVWSAGTAAAQPASDLLQSGIYYQETSGDLDSAIRVYRQILSSGPGQRLYAAQAQFRLGECLLRKGDSAAAKQAFDALSRNYPGERALVARAAELMPQTGGLLPPPWDGREVAEYAWRIPGVDDAWSAAYVVPSAKDPTIVRLGTQFHLPDLRQFAGEVDKASMRPRRAAYNGPPWRQETAGETRYEGGELPFLLRRIRLAPGWQGTFPLIAEDGTRVRMDAAVNEVEDVTVPAGTFQCYRVKVMVQFPLSVSQGSWRMDYMHFETLWYGTGPGQPLVKMASGLAVGELTGWRRNEGLGNTVFRDPSRGLSFVHPPGWLHHSGVSADKRETGIYLYSTDEDITIHIYVLPANGTLEAAAASRLRTCASRQPGYTLRYGLTRGTLGGHASMSWLANSPRSGGSRMTEYGLFVQSRTTSAAILVRASEADFERLRPLFQPILDSLRLR